MDKFISKFKRKGNAPEHSDASTGHPSFVSARQGNSSSLLVSSSHQRDANANANASHRSSDSDTGMSAELRARQMAAQRAALADAQPYSYVGGDGAIGGLEWEEGDESQYESQEAMIESARIEAAAIVEAEQARLGHQPAHPMSGRLSLGLASKTGDSPAHAPMSTTYLPPFSPQPALSSSSDPSTSPSSSSSLPPMNTDANQLDVPPSNGQEAMTNSSPSHSEPPSDPMNTDDTRADMPRDAHASDTQPAVVVPADDEHESFHLITPLTSSRSIAATTPGVRSTPGSGANSNPSSQPHSRSHSRRASLTAAALAVDTPLQGGAAKVIASPATPNTNANAYSLPAVMIMQQSTAPTHTHVVTPAASPLPSRHLSTPATSTSSTSPNPDSAVANPSTLSRHPPTSPPATASLPVRPPFPPLPTSRRTIHAGPMESHMLTIGRVAAEKVASMVDNRLTGPASEDEEEEPYSLMTARYTRQQHTSPAYDAFTKALQEAKQAAAKQAADAAAAATTSASAVTFSLNNNKNGAGHSAESSDLAATPSQPSVPISADDTAAHPSDTIPRSMSHGPGTAPPVPPRDHPRHRYTVSRYGGLHPRGSLSGQERMAMDTIMRSNKSKTHPITIDQLIPLQPMAHLAATAYLLTYFALHMFLPAFISLLLPLLISFIMHRFYPSLSSQLVSYPMHGVKHARTTYSPPSPLRAVTDPTIVEETDKLLRDERRRRAAIGSYEGGEAEQGAGMDLAHDKQQQQLRHATPETGPAGS